ncbi:MAG: hypothetical protein JJU00_20240 [Opitutales bacterium]|nr:hypothetical protein [Opitutales bacterium]
MKRISVAGQDGSGKSTLCASLNAAIPNSSIQYAGKNRSHLFELSPYALQLLDKSKEVSSLLGLIVKHTIFYPIEYIENRMRFSLGKSITDHVKIYDRHPIDRSVGRHSLQLKRAQRQIPWLHFVLRFPAAYFWDFLYRFTFPRIDCVYILLPEPEIAFTRSKGQYKTVLEAEIRRIAYERAAKSWAKRQKIVILEVFSQTTVEELSQSILHNLLSKN